MVSVKMDMWITTATVAPVFILTGMYLHLNKTLIYENKSIIVDIGCQHFVL